MFISAHSPLFIKTGSKLRGEGGGSAFNIVVGENPTSGNLSYFAQSFYVLINVHTYICIYIINIYISIYIYIYHKCLSFADMFIYIEILILPEQPQAFLRTTRKNRFTQHYQTGKNTHRLSGWLASPNLRAPLKPH